MTRPRLFLHIGLAKTGTTAIQTFAWDNRHRLHAAGVIYPERGAVAGAHHMLSPFIPPSLATAWPYEPIQSWAPALAGIADRPVVLSSELISNAGPALVGQIAAALEPWFDTRVIVYIRRIDDHVMAAFNQQIKVGHLAYAIEDMAGVLFRQLRLDRRLTPWAEAFGMENLIIRPYERAQFTGGDLLMDFCAAIGVDWQAGFQLPPGAVNSRLSRAALEYKRCLNTLITDLAALREFEAPLLDWSAQDEAGTTTAFQATALLPGATRAAMVTKMAPFYRALARKALGRKDGMLFGAPAPDPAAPWQPVSLTGEDFARITEAIATPRLRQILAEAGADAKAKADLVRISYAARFPAP